MDTGQVFVTIVGDPCADLRFWFTALVLINVVIIMLIVIIIAAHRRNQK